MESSSQKVVLVTGCSQGGIGYALCEEFSSRGCIVYATSRKLESMQGFESPNVRTRVLDVTNGDNIEHTVKGILEETERIDIVVNNAGGGIVYPVAEVSIEQVRQEFELNTFAALRISNAVLPSMFKRKQGLIINIGSIGGHITTPWNTLYCATKAALHSITEGLAMECKPFGIKVMLVAPGGVTSNILKNKAETFELPPTSVYRPFKAKILQRMQSRRESMDTNEFAKSVVSRALEANPPPYMTLGNNSTKFYWYQWLPRQYVLEGMYKTFVGEGPVA